MNTQDNRLYELRKSVKLSQTALALKLNITPSCVCAYENGRNIPCDVLKLIADYFNVSIDYILCYSDEKNKGYGEYLLAPEQNIVKLYRQLPPDGRKLLDCLVTGYNIVK